MPLRNSFQSVSIVFGTVSSIYLGKSGPGDFGGMQASVLSGYPYCNTQQEVCYHKTYFFY